MADSFKQDGAVQAKNMAERCFLRGDVAGAKQWCQNAQRLDPDLPGVAQAAAAYAVHCAAARKVLGPDGCGPDWYAVLGLPPPRSGLLTHDAVKKQYRKLCLLVHPDKNTSPAADGAFKFVQDAWKALSASHPPPEAAAAPCTRPKRAEDLYRTKPATASARKPPEPPKPTRQQQPPPPPPKQTAPRRPQVVQMRRSAQPVPAQTTRSGQKPQRKTTAPPPPVARPPSPDRGKCQYCGARTVIRGAVGAKSFRCMSCHRSPMDDKPRCSDDEYDDEYDDHDYYDDGPW
ncbi:atherin-like [Oryza brachyantha]|uniref:atherin-like n=1 Tax=Oryza brachyantha TaxID=4533 RepID=UPI001ADCE84D|nr:atherin-like [Oryza brachyantha]